MSTLTSTYADLAHAERDSHASAVPAIGARLRAWLTRPAMDPIEKMIRANGGVMTDALERDIHRRLGI